MKKIVEIEIKNMQGARKMLELSGCYDANRMTDEEVFAELDSGSVGKWIAYRLDDAGYYTTNYYEE